MQSIKVKRNYVLEIMILVTFIIAISSVAIAKKGPANGWYNRVSRLATLEGRIKDAKKDIQGLIKVKNSTKEKEKKHKIMKELVSSHKSLREMTVEYNKLREEVKYKFPEKDDTSIRRYLPIRELTIEQIETEMGLGAVLTKIKRKVDRKYESFTAESREEEAVKTPVKRHISSDIEPPKQLILEK